MSTYSIENREDELLIYNEENKALYYKYKKTLSVEGQQGQLILYENGEQLESIPWTTANLLSPTATTLKEAVEKVHNWITGKDPYVASPSEHLYRVNFGGITVPSSTSQTYDVTQAANGTSHRYDWPTVGQQHSIVSTNAQDIGVVRASGTIGSTESTTVRDTSATFTSTVSAGMSFLDDTGDNHTFVKTVVSDTELELYPWHHPLSDKPVRSGNSYRVVEATGTGASIVHVMNGLDTAGNLVNEFVVLNGTTSVTLSSQLSRANDIHVHGCGSGNTNAGNITLTADSDSTITNYIAAGVGRSQHCALSVPLGYEAVIKRLFVSIHRTGTAADAMAGFKILKQNFGPYIGAVVDGVKDDGDFGVSVHSDVNISFEDNNGSGGFRVEQLSDWWLRNVNASDNNTVVSGFIIYSLVPIA